MIRRTPLSTRTYTLFPNTTLYRSIHTDPVSKRPKKGIGPHDTRILAFMFEAPTHRCFSHEILKGDASWINELPRSQARSSRQYAKFCWTSASRKPNTARVSTISPRSHRRGKPRCFRSEEHTSE